MYDCCVPYAYRSCLAYWYSFLHQEGYIDVGSEDVKLIYFEHFNAGSAWVDVLMQNGDVYVLFLLPDNLEPVGFGLHTAEELAKNEHNHYTSLFKAIMNNSLSGFSIMEQWPGFENAVG